VWGTGRVIELKGAAKEAVILLECKQQRTEICRIVKDWFNVLWTQSNADR